MQKYFSPGQLIYLRDIILPIRNIMVWELIYQKNQMQINKYTIHKNRHKIYHNYKVIVNVMLTKHTAYKSGKSYMAHL